MGGDPLRASGGLVVRDGRILVVHRPKYDDWAFPKGKLERGETWEEAAVREVEEETSLRCTLGRFAGTTSYPMRCRNWSMARSRRWTSRRRLLVLEWDKVLRLVMLLKVLQDNRKLKVKFVVLYY